jgi:hypothetical protein
MQYVDYFAFSLHDLGVLKGQEVRINLTDDAPTYRKAQAIQTKRVWEHGF